MHHIRPAVGTAAVLLCACSTFAENAPLQTVAPATTPAAPPFDRRPQPWRRRAEPILSARTTKQSWCKIVLYSPHVIIHDGKFRMWYLGTSTASRSNDIAMGYAESSDGVTWKEHAANPILTGKQIPCGQFLQTPFVLYDDDERTFKMWFVSGHIRRDKSGKKILENDQRLGYATSRDGISWKIHPRPIYASGRSPSVIKEGPRKYRMWMGSRPNLEDRVSGSIYQNIYEFNSADGIHWKRGEKPIITPLGKSRSAVYPFVLKENGRYYLWHGCHVPGGKFEIFCAVSADGKSWKVDHTDAAFPARSDTRLFDSRYTSTPCVVRAKDRFLLYYSARDKETTYTDGNGRTRKDGAGIYAHIGVAVIKRN